MWYGSCWEDNGVPGMSIQLPRSPRELHFTGSVRSLAPERPASELGRERPKKAPPPPLSRSVPPPARRVRGGDVYAVDVQPTPARSNERAGAAPPVSRAKKLETMRGPLVSVDEEDIQTQALDRDEIDAALFPIARRANPHPAPNLPVPHFRSAAEAKAHHARPALVAPRPAARDRSGLPLSVWLVAAMIAGIVSYNFAPQALETVAQAVRAIAPP